MLTFNFDPFPELSTERLHLRRMTERDLPDFFLMRSNVAVMRYLARPIAQTEDDARKVFEETDAGITRNELINWGITFKDKNRVIGTIGFYRMKPEHHRAEVGYALHPDYHRQGIMHEAVQPVLDYGFRVMKLHSIEGVIDPNNAASERLLLKNGFVKEAYFKENWYWQGKFIDSAHYTKLTPF